MHHKFYTLAADVTFFKSLHILRLLLLLCWGLCLVLKLKRKRLFLKHCRSTTVDPNPSYFDSLPTDSPLAAAVMNTFIPWDLDLFIALRKRYMIFYCASYFTFFYMIILPLLVLACLHPPFLYQLLIEEHWCTRNGSRSWRRSECSYFMSDLGSRVYFFLTSYYQLLLGVYHRV